MIRNFVADRLAIFILYAASARELYEKHQATGRAEARRIGLPWHAVTKWKATLHREGSLRNDALGRLKHTLVAPPPAQPTP